MFRDVDFFFGGFDGSGEHLALLLPVLQIQHNEATVAVLTVSAVVAVSVMTATLKLNHSVILNVFLCAEWAASIRHLMRKKTHCNFEPQFWLEIISHHIMPKVLVSRLKDVMWCDNF